MKKLIATLLALTMLASALAGCAGQPATSQPTEQPQATPSAVPSESGGEDAATGATPEGAGVKTGLSVMTDLSSSKNASAEGDGLAQANISLVAVTVDDGGVIQDCVIDMVQAKVNFSAAGGLTSDLSATVSTKNELGPAYGMSKGSSIGKEWNEQAAAMADYAVGKTVAELKGIAVNEKGAPTDADLSASVTLSISDFLAGIEDAVNNAVHLGAKSGDRLALASVTDLSGSKDASAEGAGLAQAYTTVAAVTFGGDVITSCHIDAVQANVNFDAAGAITTDLAAATQTKNQLGDSYGMKKASSIGKEWYEQAAGFGAYVVGKTAGEVAGIAVNEKGGAADADLSASVTIGIGDFLTLIEKAAQ